MARQFNGSTQYLELASTPVANPPATFACWFNPDSLAWSSLVSSVYYTSAHQYMGLWMSDTGQAYAIYRTTSGNYTTGTVGTASVGEWSHGVAVFSSTANRSVFIDGGSKASATDGVGLANTTRIHVAARRTNAAYNHFPGKVIWPAIWDVALTDEEVASLAAGAYPPDVRPGNLVFFHPLGGFDGENDKSILNGNDLTAYNSPTWSQDEPGGLFYPSSTLLTIGSGGGDSGLSGAQKMGVNCGSSFLWGVA